jgi:hypothetical protein
MMRRKICFDPPAPAACAWPQSAAIPDTPAGHTFLAWLDAFNGGDRARIQEYISKYRVAPIPFLAIALTITS